MLRFAHSHNDDQCHSPAVPASCFCYTIDEGYILPALTSATMLRRQVLPAVADIVIVCFGPASSATRLATDVCDAEGVQFLVVPHTALSSLPMMCARFFLDDLLDAAYVDVVYLDADTQVVGPVAPFLTCPVPAGGLVAVPDLMALMCDDAASMWQNRRSYFRSIGIPDARHSTYFNSGIIRFRRADWAAISRECVALCTSSEGRSFKYPDQDALNLVLGGGAALASLRWNFPGFFLGCGLEDILSPRIVHYMSRPRPWDGAFPPWGPTGVAPYAALVSRYPALAALHKPMGGTKWIRYALQQQYKRFAYDWGTQAMRSRILRAEAVAVG